MRAGRCRAGGARQRSSAEALPLAHSWPDCPDRLRPPRPSITTDRQRWSGLRCVIAHRPTPLHCTLLHCTALHAMQCNDATTKTLPGAPTPPPGASTRSGATPAGASSTCTATAADLWPRRRPAHPVSAENQGTVHRNG
jgi:hypothetical protein